MIAFLESESTSDAESWQDGFLRLLPAIQRHARTKLRHLNAEAREDAEAEIVANAACAYRRLFERGELERAFASTLVKYAILQFYSGHRTGGSKRTGDVYSPQARKKAEYELRRIDSTAQRDSEWKECLTDNRFTSIPEQVAFRIDFPTWLDSQSPRDKRVAERLSLGYSTKEVACEFRISPARVSQLRGEFCESWTNFTESIEDSRSDSKNGAQEHQSEHRSMETAPKIR